MSDEEKKAVDELKKEINNPVEVPTDKFNTFILYNIESARTILNLIEKQSKEIEELKEDNQRYKRIASQKLDDIEEFRKNECEHRCIRNAEVLELKEYYQENYTPNDKIKAKIEECRKILYSFEKELELKANKEKYIHKESMNCLLSQISILQSLLEKE